MSFPRYPAYKDSGVEWLGKLPAHWSVTKVKALTSRISSGKTPLGGSETYVDDGVLFLRSQNVYDDGLRLDDAVFITEATDESMAVSRVQSGDVLLNITGASIGRSCVVPAGFQPANVNQHVCAIRPMTSEIGPFLSWLFKSHPVKSQIDLAQNGAAREGLNFEQIGNMSVPIAPPEEQAKLTAFLDRETAKIDALVAEQEQLITLLKEKRQAVISHAVTKGLDPSVPMKDSGVEWLGAVPEHWGLRPLKAVATFRSGGTPDKRNAEYWDGEVPWVSAKDLKVDRLADSIDHITQLALDEGAASLVPEQAIVVVVRGMILARLFPVTQLMRPMAINQDLKALVPRTDVAADYLAWLLRASEPETLNCLDEAGHGTKALRMENWGGMTVPVPPIAEQYEIAVEIDAATRQLDQLVAEAVLSIELLRERRAALISAAVTGQIDVRGLAPAQEQVA